jgi:hypothetical protein
VVSAVHEWIVVSAVHEWIVVSAVAPSLSLWCVLVPDCTYTTVSTRGIFYYHELPWRNACAWGLCALWTLVFMVLLSFEKVS